MSWGELGGGALRAALLFAVMGVGASAFAARYRDVRGLLSARWCALIALGLVALADLAMVGALVTHDFRIAYVANNNALETPLFYSVISLWAALEGSILLWTLVLAGATAFVAWRGTVAMPRLATTALGILFVMLSFFLLLVTTPAADPFTPSAIVPENGRGPNALLQNNPLMALHPPLLYLGYVLFSVPFAYALASLILGEGGDRWLVATRRYALVSWALLGTGIVAGAWWSYAVLGWGGYWAWDPVENAAIMPWLTATAYLHSVMVEEKRRLLRTWNLALVIGTFALTILGTFLTRSGIVNSVHAFSLSAIGPLLLGYLVAILVVSCGLLLWRSRELADGGALGAPLSREAVFLFQNVLFVAATLTVLLGTLYPLIAEALSGTQLSIGAPYFDRVEVPIGLALLFLMGVGPQLPWHGASRATLERQFAAPAVTAALAAVVSVAAGARGAAPVLTYALAAFVAATVTQEVARGIRARGALHGERGGTAFLALFRRNGRRYGGYVVHLGIALIAVAIAASQSGTVEAEQTLAPGGSMAVAGRVITLEAIRDVDEPQRRRVVADVRVSGASGDTRLEPSVAFYPNATQPVGTPGIGAGLDEDVYVILAAYDQRGKAWATIRTRVIPFVSWLWVGGAVIGLGSVIAALPPPRRRPVRTPAVVEAAPAGAE
ncbi:MAG TPA: cytochrome c-type biogenesis CcmF C-terminal domain-containing protein [Candidatus Limnocylindria bacterium]|nr:cytochrome c-type biogenesis CcmF C-terminal domain-containing protein [Candidatus Limnocylindria bacterium]